MTSFKYLILASLIVIGGGKSADAAEYTLDDISFMVGHWKGEGDNAPEEQWYPPEAGILPGFFRWPMEGGRQIFEMLNFVENKEGLTFHFKHFDPDLTPWEKNEANTYKVIEVKDNCLMMDLISKNMKVPAGIRYCLLDENTIEFTGRGGDENYTEATFILTMKRQESE